MFSVTASNVFAQYTQAPHYTTCTIQNDIIETIFVQKEDGMKKIPTTRGHVAIVDDDVFEELSKFKWTSVNDKYAARYFRTSGGVGHEYMHRLIMNAPENTQVDHIDGNGFNNQRANLRLCTSSQNRHNRGVGITNTSGYKGVCFVKEHGTWLARITINYEQVYLGHFSTPELAATAYNEAAIKYHGEFARLNLIPKGDTK